MWPNLDLDTDFKVWQIQFESATKAKVFSKLTDDNQANDSMLAQYRLSILPSVVSAEILEGCTEKFSLGTTTYNTAIQAVKEQWIRITRPQDVTQELHLLKIATTDDVMPTWRRILRLQYYSTFGNDFIIHSLINAIVDPSIKQTVQAFIYGKTIVPKDVVDFMLTLSFGTTMSQSPPSLVAAIRIRCYNCNRSGHYSRDCKEQRIQCHNCKKYGHMARFCRSPKNEPRL